MFHPANEVKLTISGVDYSLQEAIDSGIIGGADLPDCPAGDFLVSDGVGWVCDTAKFTIWEANRNSRGQDKDLISSGVGVDTDSGATISYSYSTLSSPPDYSDQFASLSGFDTTTAGSGSELHDASVIYRIWEGRVEIKAETWGKGCVSYWDTNLQSYKRIDRTLEVKRLADESFEIDGTPESIKDGETLTIESETWSNPDNGNGRSHLSVTNADPSYYEVYLFVEDYDEQCDRPKIKIDTSITKKI
tara:strand:+ start:218 stop:958 length:741 start_codon:yes stop_codon:yes gene_type:complete